MTSKTITMTISLPESLKGDIERRTSSGQFGNSSEYIRTLIRDDLTKQDKLVRLRRLADEGDKALSGGEYAVFDEKVLAKIMAEGRAERDGSGEN
jgi:antitoxin ParD1/3/4